MGEVRWLQLKRWVVAVVVMEEARVHHRLLDAMDGLFRTVANLTLGIEIIRMQ